MGETTKLKSAKFILRVCMYGDTVPDHQIDNLLQIMNMKVRNFTVGKVTCSEIFGFLYVSVRAIPTYRVY